MEAAAATATVFPEPLLPQPADGVVRQFADYHPTVWGDYFVTHKLPTPTNMKKSEEWVKQRIEELVRVVKGKLSAAGHEDVLKQMELIDDLERLGVSYHFEQEIEESLRCIHDDINAFCDGVTLHAVALHFRLLRQHAYNVPSDVFEKFMSTPTSRSAFEKDAKALLSLYEAGYLRVPGEAVLDEAIDFARDRLFSMADRLDQPLKRQGESALQTPLRKKVSRLEAKDYLSIYEEVDLYDADVLELAKLDFHLLQSLHREEVKRISAWWRSLGLVKEFTFARDRVVECYFWILGVYFEPKYSRGRVMMTKVIALLSLTDDIYDVYGTLDELERFTAVIQSWDTSVVDRLEPYLRAQFGALDRTFNVEFREELAAEANDYRVDYFIEQVKGSSRAWLEEARWRDGGYVPGMEEYLRVSNVTTCYPTLTCASFVGMPDGEAEREEAFEWIATHPKILMDATLICRLMDDIVSQELEQQRKHVASAVQCYMKDHGGMSMEEAVEKLTETVEETWKEFNKEWLAMAARPMALGTRILNLARIMETLYKKIDAYTHSDTLLKDYITALLVEPVSF